MLNELAKRVWLRSVSEEQSGEHKFGESASDRFRTPCAQGGLDVPQPPSLDVPNPLKDKCIYSYYAESR